MAYALRGSVGAVATGTASVVPALPQVPLTGSLLVAWIVAPSGSPSAGTMSGYTFAGVAGTSASIYYKVATASESNPTFTGSGTMFARIAEFTGNDTVSPKDQNGANTAVTSTATATCAGADAAGGELVVAGSLYLYSMAGTVTNSHSAYNNGATATGAANNNATSTTTHYVFDYGITTGNAAADAVTDTFTTTNISLHALVVVSFKLAAAGGGTKAFPFVRRQQRFAHMLVR